MSFTLETRDLTIRFGGHVAVDLVNCIFRPGVLTAIIGPNGAGKTTFGFEINGRTLTCYTVFVASGAMTLALLRIVNSPFGRVLQAIHENPFRAEALGYRTILHLTYANCISALVAARAGVLNALWLRYAGPDTSLRFSIMIDVLLMGGSRWYEHDVRRDHRRHSLHSFPELPTDADESGTACGRRC